MRTGTPACKSSRPFTRAANSAPPSRPPDATQQQALAQFQTTVEDTLLAVRLAYYDTLLAAQQITVHEASVNLLQKELEDQQHRLDAGTVPKFNVLRAEVAVANDRPNLIRAKNDYRIAKNNLANLLGYNLPRDIWENIPLNLTDALEAAPYDVNLPDAIQQALHTPHGTRRFAPAGGVATAQQRQRQGRLQADGAVVRRLQLV